MRQLKVQKLTPEKFGPYGTYADLENPQPPKLGDEFCEFFRDMILVNLGSTTQASISLCRCHKRPFVIDSSEYHTFCSEGAMPLNGAMIIHVGSATPPSADVPIKQLQAFYVPKGTFVAIKPGVWHGGPFTTTDEPVDVLIVLPERTYANDCSWHKLNEKDYIKIIGF